MVYSWPAVAGFSASHNLQHASYTVAAYTVTYTEPVYATAAAALHSVQPAGPQQPQHPSTLCPQTVTVTCCCSRPEDPRRLPQHCAAVAAATWPQVPCKVPQVMQVLVQQLLTPTVTPCTNCKQQQIHTTTLAAVRSSSCNLSATPPIRVGLDASQPTGHLSWPPQAKWTAAERRNSCDNGC